MAFPLLILFVVMLLSSNANGWGAMRSPTPGVTPPPLCSSQFALASQACSQLPYRSVLPPPLPRTSSSIPPSPSEAGDELGHQSRHRESPIESNCCRWLKEVDDICVCQMLVKLPAFMTRPVHEYTVVVDGVCSVTYVCGSRLRPTGGSA